MKINVFWLFADISKLRVGADKNAAYNYYTMTFTISYSDIKTRKEYCYLCAHAEGAPKTSQRIAFSEADQCAHCGHYVADKSRNFSGQVPAWTT
jgi:hypothetical protein